MFIKNIDGDIGFVIHDKKNYLIISVIVILVIFANLFTASATSASQIPGHVYIALKALEDVPEMYSVLENDLDYYVSGSVGPDLCFISYPVRQYMGWTNPGSLPHHYRSGQKTSKLLEEAITVSEMAFSLGWYTHYITDITIHPLVNHFGGYSSSDYPVDYEERKRAGKRHRLLELFESKHVFSKYVHPTSGSAGNLNNYIIKPGSAPKKLIADAFKDTYYEGSFDTSKHKSSFAMPIRYALNIGSLLMYWSSESFVNKTTDSHRSFFSPKRMIDYGNEVFLGRMPTAEEYEQIMNPLYITDVTLSAGEDENELTLRVDYRVNDIRLLKVFADRWDLIHLEAIERIKGFFVGYEKKTNYKIEDLNLNTGLPESLIYNFSNDLFPGNPDITHLKVKCNASGSEKTELARWPSMGGEIVLGALDELVWNGPAGSGFFEIPINESADGFYNIEISVEFASEPFFDSYGIISEWNGYLNF